MSDSSAATILGSRRFFFSWRRSSCAASSLWRVAHDRAHSLRANAPRDASRSTTSRAMRDADRRSSSASSTPRPARIARARSARARPRRASSSSSRHEVARSRAAARASSTPRRADRVVGRGLSRARRPHVSVRRHQPLHHALAQGRRVTPSRSSRASRTSPAALRRMHPRRRVGRVDRSSTAASRGRSQARSRFLDREARRLRALASTSTPRAQDEVSPRSRAEG